MSGVKLTDQEKRALRKAAFVHAASKDRRREGGASGRVDFMLDQQNGEKKKKKGRRS
jgi:hypothetical protein